jgi:hypothetical protein
VRIVFGLVMIAVAVVLLVQTIRRGRAMRRAERAVTDAYEAQLAALIEAAAKAEHMRLFDGEQHQCCWVVGTEQCGLWCCHDGDHTADRVGDYLPMAMPIIHPLDLLRLRLSRWPWRDMACLLCGTRSGPPWWTFGYTTVLEGVVGRFYGEETTLSTERHWRFEPCGCEGREILEEQHD